MKIDVRSNTAQVVAELNADMVNVNKAQARALNRTAEQLRTEAGRQIRADYNVTLRGIRQASLVKRASTTSKFPRAEVIFSGRSINLVEFGARQTKKGVTVQVKKRGGRKLIEHAFLQIIKGGQNAGKKGAFRRTGKERYPIHFLPSLAIPQMVASRAINAALLKFADEKYTDNLEHELIFLMKKL